VANLSFVIKYDEQKFPCALENTSVRAWLSEISHDESYLSSSPLSDAITLIEADTFLELGMSPSHYFFSAQQFVLKTSLCLDATTFPFSSVRMHGRFRKQSSSVTISLLNHWQLFLIHVYSLDKAAATYTVNIYNLKMAVTWAEAESDVTLWQNHPNPALPLFDFIA